MELPTIVEHLNALVPNPNIYIGGSYALQNCYGLLNHRKPNDIDVIIYRFTQEQLDWLWKHFFLSVEGVHYTKHDKYINLNNDKNIFYIQAFNCEQAVKINFITYRKSRHFNASTVYRGIPVLPLKAIIDAKLDYGRDKDKADILAIMLELNNLTNLHLPLYEPKSTKNN